MTYLLLAYIVIGGAWHTEIIDHDLSADDCAYALAQQATDDAPLACEPDLGTGE